ncbi:inner membrane protein YpjD [Methylotenera sp.]|uniref:cytochrome C assembly family protein n=1 Tax=Methylotenera sp. TaxID=2051956 RepID=UPI00272F0223|nr:cytochrome c biogenesis protein CcsA [Methylotenera sp.]MDP2231337.1 cytochrome c biogenesis protein CcsA [Methylotenera sp.]MDP3141948.1 cytochrome c biogenesis protein CcsA [Methylotenera sp.]
MQKLISYFAVVFIYLAVATDFWRCAKTPAMSQYLKLHSTMIAFGLIIHAWLLYQTIFVNGYNLGFFNVLSAIAWLTVLIYWVADLNHKLTSLQAFVLPPAAIFALLPASNATNHFMPLAESPLFLAHITIALLAYSLFTFATFHALLMTAAERSLHNKPTLIKLPSFPPLMVMESLLFRIISLGFILLTITLVSGMLFSEEIFGKPMQFNHKAVFSIASWFIYGGLLYGRYQYGWRGLKAIRWTLAGFILLVLAYVGSKFILEVLLGR